MKNSQKAQISLEYGLVIGFSLLILLPTILIAQSYSSSYQDSIGTHETQRAADLIVAYADTVQLEGPPSKRTFSVNLPAFIENITTYNKTIIFTMKEGTQVVYSTTTYSNLTWEGDYKGKGKYTLTVQADTATVRIKDAS